MFETQGLEKTYQDGTAALRGVDIQMPREKVFAILGTSGAGKTTLLQCLARFLAPSAGRILLDGQDALAMPNIEFRRRVGIVFQQLNLFPHLTIAENLELAPRLVQGMDPAACRKAAMETLARLGVENLASSYPAQVSGGQAQRAAIGRALVLEPEYVLLDEPTSALDINTTREFGEWLVQLKAKTTFVLVTHDLPFAEATAEHAILLEHGLVKARGTVAEVKAHWSAV